jgi:V-type H+-transporting ATPase proteolipid subunit
MWAPALGFGGATAALSMSCVGSAYGTGKAGVGISSIGVHSPEIVMKSMIPVVMAGVLGIYGLIIAVIIADGVRPHADSSRPFSDYTAYTGFAHLAAGLCCGLSGLSAGIAIGIVGDASVRAVQLQRKVYVGMVLILIFAEALGLYGLIVGLILTSKTSDDCGVLPTVASAG